MISMLEQLQEIARKVIERQRESDCIKVGDIIKVQSCHDPAPCCYEVSSIENGEYVSQPAHFKHRRNDILAVYRFDGQDYKCIWLRNEKG